MASLGHAGVVLYNSTANLALGINDDGSLGSTSIDLAGNGSFATGLAFQIGGNWADGISNGSTTEGWGISANNSTSGFAGSGSLSNLSVGPMSGTTTSASLTTLPGLTVTQTVQSATNAPGSLFRMDVTIANHTGSGISNLKYVRVMDWDVAPTDFQEYVTMQGTGSTSRLENSSNNGLGSADPLNPDPLPASEAATENTDFIDFSSIAGGNDQGAYFRFNFGNLGDAASYRFTLFYGATGTEDEAIAALAAEGVGLYSLGQSGNGGEATGSPVTYMFGFLDGGASGGPTGNVPEPGSLALLALGLGGLAAVRRRV